MRLRLPIRLFFAIAAGFFIWSCASTEVGIGSPIDLQINATSPVAVGDSLQLEYQATGRQLLGMVILWGDAEFDSVFMNAAQSAAGTAGHVYADTGSYTVTARLLDAVEGSDEKSVTVRIDP